MIELVLLIILIILIILIFYYIVIRHNENDIKETNISYLRWFYPSYYG